jgi:hypothetical protein
VIESVRSRIRAEGRLGHVHAVDLRVNDSFTGLSIIAPA